VSQIVTRLPKNTDALIHKAIDVDQLILLISEELSSSIASEQDQMKEGLSRIGKLAAKNAGLLNRVRE
jgi:hypothetical protein